MSKITATFCNHGCTALAMVNALLILALCGRLHHAILNPTGSAAVVFSPPSIIIVLMAVIGLAILAGSRWIRPPWLDCAVQLTLLATGCLLLMKS